MAALLLVSSVSYHFIKVSGLEKDLAECEGSPKQQQLIDKLTQELNEASQREAQKIEEIIEALPDDCYYLDGPSPLNDVLREYQQGSD